MSQPLNMFGHVGLVFLDAFGLCGMKAHNFKEKSAQPRGA